MKLLLLSVFFITSCSSKIFIVRHAEKSTEPQDNPHLNSYGMERAEILKNLLKNKKITSIYSTNTNRTMETAKPLGSLMNITVIPYKNDTLQQLFTNIFKSKKNTLVVGHSNTVLTMLDTMHLKRKKKVIQDLEYDNLFIVKVKKYCATCSEKFKATVKEKKYGSRTMIATVKKPIR